MFGFAARENFLPLSLGQVVLLVMTSKVLSSTARSIRKDALPSLSVGRISAGTQNANLLQRSWLKFFLQNIGGRGRGPSRNVDRKSKYENVLWEELPKTFKYPDWKFKMIAFLNFEKDKSYCQT